MITNVLFKFDVDSGKIAGTGHMMRCLTIYNLLKKKYKNSLKYYFFFNNYSDSKKIVRKYIKKNLIVNNKKSFSNISFLNNNSLIINDTPNKIDKFFLKYCEKNNLKNLVLIDHNKINYPYSYTLINGIYYFKKKINSLKNVYQGFKYILLNKMYSSVKKKRSNILKILITTGGTDNKNVVYKIYNNLKDIKDIKFYVVIGPGFMKENFILKEKNKNIIFIKNKKNLKPYFEKTDVSITAGGISMFESICSKNITLVTQLYENQKYSIKHLNDLKMITLIGKNNYINQDKLRKIILNLINIKKIKQIKIPKNFKLIDGKSLFRIEKILFKIINKNIG